MYQHLSQDGSPIDLPATRALCIGRNYMDHIAELNSAVPDEALLFMKPAPALCHLSEPLIIPTDKGQCHNELEVAVLISQPLCQVSEADVEKAIWGVGLGLDLTLRDVQSQLKQKGHPWERAKAFDFSCPVTPFIPYAQIADLQDLHFTLNVNNQVRQQGQTAKMMRPVTTLIAEMSSIFTLQPGDIILTGTPKGVGPLQPGDALSVALEGHLSVSTSVVS
ncbi:fumarylacetoacetate hydrolase family protein [Alteromonas sp. C1M14]|uniref:fumarylacetoacetate hydrolase family protein n=1 Tax=Alteromonas sp. C1M14 TaxID=2841567 RepID=UPI001C091CD8|nr:fumarylacetoacetate hydrolase family protein [Alteromonas sp. C1M14]MBU2979764.1 fumarylacetoacetate hydrolase family protein [Alteromonas sp. C1M14]